jgi:DNA mismatch repair protein MSH3
MEYSAAFDYLTAFYKGDGEESMEVDEEGAAPRARARGADLDSIGVSAGLPAEEAVLALVDFPQQVVVALSLVIKYLTPFGLENAFRHRSSFTHFVNRAHMLLSSNTLANLEIYRNQTDGGQYGSLLWLLDQTRTRMGRRLMREWIGRPLLDTTALRARQDAVEEFMTTNNYHLEKLRSLLVNMPDLVRGLTRIQYGKVTPAELSTILVGLVRVGSEFKPDAGHSLASDLLNNVIETLPTIAQPAKAFLEAINMKAAKADEKVGHHNWLYAHTRPTSGTTWTDTPRSRMPKMWVVEAPSTLTHQCISICEAELNEHLKQVRAAVKRPTLAYVTVSGIEYLLEIPVRDAKTVPPKWVKISA